MLKRVHVVCSGVSIIECKHYTESGFENNSDETFKDDCSMLEAHIIK